MKDKEARQATLANKQAIEHFFESEREFIDKIAEIDNKLQNLSGRLGVMEMLINAFAKGVFEDQERARDLILMALSIGFDTNAEGVKALKDGDTP